MTGIVIQARMGSTRLPNKVLMPIGEKPLLEHILLRLKRLRGTARVVVATTVRAQDDDIQAFCTSQNTACFRGDEENVLDRYYACAQVYGFSQIVRMTADNPFPDIEELDRLLDLHERHGNDFSECFSVLPIGIGMEVFSWEALEKSLRFSTLPHHFEHVDEYILENKDDFLIETLEVPDEKRHPDIRLTVDTQEDYELACRIVNASSSEYIGTQEAIRLCLQFA